MPEPLTTAPLDTAAPPAISFAEPFERHPAATAAAPATALPKALGAAQREPTIERPVDFQPISRTKITPPLLRRETLTRGRLIERLRLLTRRRLTLVIAEAGYGKTTLLGDFGRVAERPCLWYKLDANDGDWVTLANYLVAAVRELVPDFGVATTSLLRQLVAADPPRRLVIDTLIAEIGRLQTSATLVLDDFHLVDDNTDALEITTRLLQEAPPDLSFVVATRRRPDLPLARLTAQGEVGELLTEELRFSRVETDELFSETYQQPLDPDVLDQLDRKAEGWAASLQLFHSSIRGRSNLEIRSFARSLSGSDGPVYDFLAEEVLRELTPPLRRFLTRAAILERIVPDLVVALFADLDEPPGEMVARGWIEAADDLGLLGRRGAAGQAYRFHPLLREFLLRQLEREHDPASMRAMHLRVAETAERSDWLVACHHFLEARAPGEAVRVMGDSLLVAMGTGARGTASSLLQRLEEEPAAPAVQVILALRQIEDGDVDEAEHRLNAIDLTSIPAEMRSLVRHALLRAAFNRGDLETGRSLVDSILDDPASPDLVLRLARSTEILHLRKNPPLREIGGVLRLLTEVCEARNLHYFTGISLHNHMEVDLAAGLYADAYRRGERAIEEFALAGQRRSQASAHATLAICAAELDRRDLMEEHLNRALEPRVKVGADSAVTSSYLMTVLGEEDRAAMLLAIAEAAMRTGSTDAAVATWYRLAVARRAIALHQTDAALAALEPSTLNWAVGPGARPAAATLRSIALLQAGDVQGSSECARRGSIEANDTGAHSWTARLGVIEALARRDQVQARNSIARAAAAGALAVLDVSEAISTALDLLSPLPSEIQHSIARHPERWRLVLRRQMDEGPSLAAQSAARLLDEVGTAEDIPLLRAYERTYLRGHRGSKLGRKLAERESPPLVVHDLGRAWFEVGTRSVDFGRIRRRAASLLTYLIARPKQIATRERVLDDLWPDLPPAAAANSLNQTLYFLRREIDPWYEDGASIDYVQFQGETLSLTPGLVSAESIEFHRTAVQLLSRDDVSADELRACQSRYVGNFAPEFEYEDWSADWRGLLHTTYLHLVSYLQRCLVTSGDFRSAISVTQSALAVDPRSPELHQCLIWLLGASGFRAAAAEQYSRYVTVVEEELGQPAQALSELVEAPFPAG